MEHSNNNREGQGRDGRRMNRREEPVSEFKEKLVFVNRVAKVVKGGKNFRFTALMVVGDEMAASPAGWARPAEIPRSHPQGCRRSQEEDGQRSAAPAHDDPRTRFSCGVSEPGKGASDAPPPKAPASIAGGPVRAVIEAGRHQGQSAPRRTSAPTTRSTWSRPRSRDFASCAQIEEVAKLRGNDRLKS
jgi:small subunit ribosomal protein S5